MTDRQHFVLSHSTARNRAMHAIAHSPDGYVVDIKPPTRSGDQNALFHAICADLAKSDVQWAGKRRNAAAWKVLLVSGHSAATKEGVDMVPGIEGEFVNLRESTALMSKARGSSLIEYSHAFCAMQVVRLHEEEPA